MKKNKLLKEFIKKVLTEEIDEDSAILMLFAEMIEYAGHLEKLGQEAGFFFSEDKTSKEQKEYLIKFLRNFRIIKKNLTDKEGLLHEIEQFARIEIKRIQTPEEEELKKTGKLVNIEDYR